MLTYGHELVASKVAASMDSPIDFAQQYEAHSSVRAAEFSATSVVVCYPMNSVTIIYYPVLCQVGAALRFSLLIACTSLSVSVGGTRPAIAVI